MLHLSDTKLDMLSRCGEQYRRRYLEGERRPPGVALLVGRGVDQAVTANMRRKIEAGRLLTPDEVGAIARDSVAKEWDNAGEIALSEDEQRTGAERTRGDSIDRAVRLARVHALQVAPGLRPTAAQRAWEVDLQGTGLPVMLRGVIDVQEGAAAIRDTKTARKSPPKTAAETSSQLTIYALASRLMDGVMPASVALDFLVDKRYPEAVTLESTRSEQDFAPVFARIERAVHVIESGAFAPADPDDWHCSAKFCGFWSTCPFALRPTSVSMTAPSETRS